MSKIRLAVIGAGHLGRIHTRLASQVEGAELVGFVEPDAAARERVSGETKAAGFAKLEEIIDRIDAAVIATPTRFHHQVAMTLLKAKKHVLVEKPITVTLDEADELIETAEKSNLVLAVGHVERFNPALDAALPHIGQAKYIEGARTTPYTFRSTDVGVVLDLMIHDIDAVLSIADSPLVDVQALGIAVFGPHEDMAQARLTFANGCVANLTASRTSFTPQRVMHVYSDQGYAAVDFAAKRARVVHPGHMLRDGVDGVSLSMQDKEHIKGKLFEDEKLLPLKEVVPADRNALLDEQSDFCEAIRSGGTAKVSGVAGRNALDAAQQIVAALNEHRWDGMLTGRVGPHALSPSIPFRKAA